MKRHKFIYSLIIGFLASIALSIPAAAQSVYVISGQVRDHQGNVVPAATVIILSGNLTTVNTATQPGSPLATIYSDPAGTMAINQLTNPVTTNGTGQFVAYAAPGNYVIQAYRNGFQIVTPISITTNGIGCSVTSGGGEIIFNNMSGGCSIDPRFTFTASTGNETVPSLEDIQYVDCANSQGRSGSDIGAWINAAMAALPSTGGYVYIAAGSCSYSTSIVITLNVLLAGAGRNSMILRYTGTGDAIQMKAGTNAPYMNGGIIGLTLIGNSNPNAVGIHHIDTIGSLYDDLSIENFTGTNSAGMWFDNQVVDSERLSLRKLSIYRNTVGWEFTNSDGTPAHSNSFGYWRVSEVQFQIAANQTGISATGVGLISDTASILIYNGQLAFDANLESSTSILVNLAMGSAFSGGRYDINAECTGCSGATGFNIDSTSTVIGDRSTHITLNDMTNTVASGGVYEPIGPTTGTGPLVFANNNTQQDSSLQAPTFYQDPSGHSPSFAPLGTASLGTNFNSVPGYFNAGCYIGTPGLCQFKVQLVPNPTATNPDYALVFTPSGGSGFGSIQTPSLNITGNLEVPNSAGYTTNGTHAWFGIDSGGQNPVVWLGANFTLPHVIGTWAGGVCLQSSVSGSSDGIVEAACPGGSAFSGGLGASFQDVTEITAPADPASGNDRLYLSSSTHLLACVTSGGANCMPSAGGSLAVGTTTVSGGTNGYILYDNAGVLGAENPSSLGITIAGTSVGLGGSTTSFPNPGAIGSGTPAAANFTTLGASGHVIFNGLQTTGTIAFAICLDSSGNLIANASGNCYSGGGGGTVTSVALSMPSIFGVSGSPITGAGTLTATLNNQSANQVFAGPCTGSAATPAFRFLCNQDIPLPTTSLQGGVIALSAAVSNQFETYIDTSGVQHTAQVNFSNLAGSASCSQLPALTGDTTSSAGSCGTTTSKINGGAMPASAAVLGSNSSSQPIAATASQVNGVIQGLTGCNTIGYVYTPQAADCVVAGAGPGTGTQYEPAYWATTATLGSAMFATTPNGVPQTLIEVPSGSALTAPVGALPGIAGRAVTGTTSTDTIVSADCSPNRIEYMGSVAVAITLPTATTLAVPKCVFKVTNNTSGSSTALTITPTTWTINGSSTAMVNQGEQAFVYVDPNSSTNWVADISPLEITASTNVTFTRSATGIAISASGGGGGVNTCGSSGTFIPTYATTTTVSCSLVQIDSNGNVIFPTPSGISYGTVTQFDLGCVTASGTIANCTTFPANNFLGVFTTSTGGIQQTGFGTVNLDANVNVTYGDILCASSSTATAHDNGSTPCANGEWIGIATITASSVTSTKLFMRLQ